MRDGDDLVTVLDVPAPLAALGASVRCRRSTASVEVELAGRHAAGRDARRARPGHAARCAAGARGDLRVVVNVVIPRRLDRDSASCSRSSPTRSTDDNLRADEESMFAKLRRASSRVSA